MLCRHEYLLKKTCDFLLEMRLNFLNIVIASFD